MASKLMEGQNGHGAVGTNAMGMGMNQPSFGSFGNFMNPYMFGMPQNQPNQQQPNQQQPQALSATQQNFQQMIQNSLLERTYAVQLKELE